jgi:hypothetical protein
MTTFSVSIAPLLPVSLLLVVATVSAIVVAIGLWRRQRGSGLRAIAFALILFSLFDPSLVREDREGLKDVIAVVLDRSGSQTIGDRTQQTDRVRAQLEQKLAALPNIETRFIDAGDSSDNQGTKLFSALKNGLADVPPERVGAALLVTDGIVHDIPKQSESLGFQAPVHALITGHPGERDRRIELVDGPRFGIVGKDQTISVRIIDAGGNGEPVVLDIRRDGAPLATMPARPDELVRIPVHVEHAGANVFEIEVPALPNELTTLNNKAVVTIEGIRDKLRVLLVSGEPHAGERAWRNLLKADANVDLVHFTILRSPDNRSDTPVNELALIAFPTGELFERKISQFDLIIFDRYANQNLILPPYYLENIVRYVREGGALLLAAGPEFSGVDSLYYSPIGKILPAQPNGQVIEQAFRAAVTDDGRKHPVTRGLPGADSDPPQWSEWFRQIGANSGKGVRLLAGADERPLLVLSREGKGRVALLLSDQLWLWARGFREGGPHLDLMRRLAHWLMKEPDLEEEALRAAVQGRTIYAERQSLKPEAANVTIAAPSGKTDSLALHPSEPGLSRAQYVAPELGLYKLTDGELSVLANVGPDNPLEFQDVISTTEKLRPLIEATGGTVRRLAAAAGDAINIPRIVAQQGVPTFGGSDFIGVKRTNSSVVRGVGIMPLALGWSGILALLGIVLLTWLYEGRRRLAE